MKRFYKIAMSLWLAALGLYSCSSEDSPAEGPEMPSDTLWYEVTNMSEFTAEEFVDSLCQVEEAAAEHMGMVTQMIPKGTTVTIIDYLYESSDGQGGKARLSAQLLVPETKGRVRNESLIIDNRATQIADADVPTNQLNVGAVLCLSGAPVVTADLLGYGASVHLPISYNCYHTAGVNTVDAAVVAQQMLHSKWLGLGLKTRTLPVYNEGYSQGGYDALAVQRYLETEASRSVVAQLPLKKTKCGAGAYDQRAFLEAVMKWEDYAYSPYIVTSVISFMNYHRELFPDDFTIESILNEKVRNSQLVERINSKLYGDRAIKDYVLEILDGDISMSNLFDEDLINPNGKLHKICMEVAGHETIMDGWKPKAPVDFFHAKNDDCVPVECMYAAREAFKDCHNVTFEEYDAPAVPSLHSLSYVRFITGILLQGWE